MRLNWQLIFLLLLAPGWCFAQELAGPTLGEQASNIALQESTGDSPPSPPRNTLPPVEVRPAPMIPSVPSNSDGGMSGSSSPPGNNLNSDIDNFFNNQDSGVESIYPSLQSLGIGISPLDVAGLNSALRSEKSLFEMPQFGSVVDRQMLDQKMASDMYRALQNETGVLLQSTGRGQLSPFIRGLTGQQIVILVDGIRMNNSVLRSGPNQYAATIDPGQIERVEVVRGANSVLWGSDAIGGAINIVTRGADTSRGDYTGGSLREFFATADNSSYTRGNVEAWYGKTGVFAGASYMGVHDLDRGGGLGRQPFTNYDQMAGDIKINRIINDDAILTVAFQHFSQFNLPRSDRFLPFVTQPRPDGGINRQRPTFIDQERDLAYLRLQGLAANENMFFDAYTTTMSYSLTREGQTDFTMPSNNPAAIPTRREDGEFKDHQLGVTVALTKDGGDLGKLTYGGDYYYEDISAYRLRKNNPNNPNSVFVPVAAQYPNDARADRMGTFANWDVNLTQRLSATAGVRYENLDMSATPDFNTGPLSFARNYTDWIGSVGLSYEVTEEFRFVGGVYEGFRAPTIDDLTANKTALQNVQTVPRLGNLGIGAEHSYTYEAGFKWNSDRLRLQAYQWWTDFDSYIGRETIVVAGTPTEFLSNQKAFLNGTEANAEWLLERGWSIYGNGAYTYGVIDSIGQPFPRIPPLQGTVGFRWRDDRQRYFDVYTWLVDRVDQKHYNQFNLTDTRFIRGGTPGYGTLNVRAGTALGAAQNHKLSIALENITDQYYRVLGSGVDGAGFNALFGYEYQR